MGREELENLVRIGSLEAERFRQGEFDGLVDSGRARLKDARRTELTLASRFDLAYNAAHALSLAALRRAGYRSKNRIAVLQSLPHILDLAHGNWRLLLKAHGTRNDAEYEGESHLDERFVDDLIAAAAAVEAALTP